MNDLAQAINEGKQTDIVFMDFRKAFDKVSHKLMPKLGYYIKNDHLLTWIRALLPDQSLTLLTDTNSSP